jgi:NAD(P)-dependent dehydrogenase (short-subunit alcohol dehydrogenase family)
VTFKNNFQLDGKVCVVTGGAGLLGREFIRAIVENKGIAVIADKNKKISLQFKNDLSEELNSKHIDSIDIDITSKKNVKKLIKYLHNKYGRIDSLVNNAYPKNKNYGKHFFDVEYNDFIENIGMHLGGYFITSQQFAIYFKDQGYGNILNISSMYGVIPPKFEIYEGTKMTTPVEYAVIKSGLIHITKYMAKYFKGMNIRVNALSPGGIFDNQPKKFLSKYNKMCLNKGMLDKKDLNDALIFLLSDSSKYLNGQNIVVDDGFSL